MAGDCRVEDDCCAAAAVSGVRALSQRLQVRGKQEGLGQEGGRDALTPTKVQLDAQREDARFHRCSVHFTLTYGTCVMSK